MILSWLLIGTIVGLVMGLTGSGGLLSVPLFIYVDGATVHAATVYSLIVIFTGSIFNWISQRKDTIVPLALTMAVFSYLGSWLFIPVKKASPEFVILGSYALVCLLSLAGIWLKKSKADSDDLSAGTSEKGAEKAPEKETVLEPENETYIVLGDSFEYEFSSKQIIMGIISGVLLGVISTMTGLGGGVVLLPWLTTVIGLPIHRAVATSLLTVTLVAMGSIFFQWEVVAGKVTFTLIGVLAAGAVIAVVILKALFKKYKMESLNLYRRWMYTAVIAVALGSLLLHL